MKNMNDKIELTFKGYQSVIKFGTYADNNNTAIQLVGAKGTDYHGELIAIATVNTYQWLPEKYVAIKNWSENEGMVAALVDANVIDPYLYEVIPCGFMNAKVYPLSKAALNIFKKENQ